MAIRKAPNLHTQTLRPSAPRHSLVTTPTGVFKLLIFVFLFSSSYFRLLIFVFLFSSSYFRLLIFVFLFSSSYFRLLIYFYFYFYVFCPFFITRLVGRRNIPIPAFFFQFFYFLLKKIHNINVRVVLIKLLTYFRATPNSRGRKGRPNSAHARQVDDAWDKRTSGL